MDISSLQTIIAGASAIASPLVTWLAMKERIARVETKVDALLTVFLEREAATLTPAARALLSKVMDLSPARE